MLGSKILAYSTSSRFLFYFYWKKTKLLFLSLVSKTNKNERSQSFSEKFSNQNEKQHFCHNIFFIHSKRFAHLLELVTKKCSFIFGLKLQPLLLRYQAYPGGWKQVFKVHGTKEVSWLDSSQLWLFNELIITSLNIQVYFLISCNLKCCIILCAQASFHF